MNYTYLHYQIGLTLLYGVGPIRARRLIDLLPSLTTLFTCTTRELHAITGLNPLFLNSIQRENALRKAEAVIEYINQNEIEAIYFEDTRYPQRLKNCDDAPLILYVKGGASLNPRKIIAIVGTRNATAYGKELCRQFIEPLQKLDLAIVSGLALGIDACAHRYSLENTIPTIGVLGHGLDRIYPSQHRALANKLLEEGALVTEFIPGTLPDRENFPRRNRIVAGMCDAIIVVESGQRGGSLITAELANSYNRDVFAFPGSAFSNTSQGCNRLIANNKAHLIQSADDFLQLMGWSHSEAPKTVQRKMFTQLSAYQKTIVEVLMAYRKLPFDVLCQHIDMPSTQINSELFGLEMEGVICKLPGDHYSMP